VFSELLFYIWATNFGSPVMTIFNPVLMMLSGFEWKPWITRTRTTKFLAPLKNWKIFSLERRIKMLGRIKKTWKSNIKGHWVTFEFNLKVGHACLATATLLPRTFSSLHKVKRAAYDAIERRSRVEQVNWDLVAIECKQQCFCVWFCTQIWNFLGNGTQNEYQINGDHSIFGKLFMKQS